MFVSWQAHMHKGSALTTTAQRCNVGDAGAEALAATLERNNSLQTLKLEVRQHKRHLERILTAAVQCSNISDAGAGFLASALERNGTLQVLDLWVSDMREGARDQS